MEWISVNDTLPQISYLESDNESDPYECYPVLLFSQEDPGIYCVGYLVQEQDENDWNFEKLSWEFYIPGADGGDILHKDFETFSHWMPLPELPKD